MGVNCIINLNRSQNGTYLPGEGISGIIKYTVDEPTEFSRITISLKGKGYLKIIERNRDNREHIYSDTEVYVDDDYIIEEGKIEKEPGPYNLHFNFDIPTHIPPSYDHRKVFNKISTVSCKIKYYIRIKFEKPGLFQFAKHFKKEIVIAPGIIPDQHVEPKTYEQQRKLLQLFTKKPSIVNIKANIENSVIQPGGKIELKYEVINDTNIKIKSVKAKLMEMHVVKVMCESKAKTTEAIPGTESETLPINSGETHSTLLEMFVPSSVSSLEYAEIVSKRYFVKITAELPLPYRNVNLDIPVQIGQVLEKTVVEDNPPTYWEAMGETKNDNDLDSK